MSLLLMLVSEGKTSFQNSVSLLVALISLGMVVMDLRHFSSFMDQFLFVSIEPAEISEQVGCRLNRHISEEVVKEGSLEGLLDGDLG